VRATASAQDVVTDKWMRPIAVVAVGMFMSLLDVTIVNVAVPAIQKDFGGSLEDVLWIATGYTLTLGVVVPLTSWLGDRFGLTRLYLGAIIGFALGSALCGLAWNLGFLVAARVLQAVPGGILPVVCVAIVYRIVPKDKISGAMGILGLAFVAAPAAGPVVGGYLVEHLDWRLVFYINLPIGFLTAIASLLWVPKVPTAPGARFDIAGFLAIAVSLTAILLAASKGEDWGWGSYSILILISVGVLSMALFVVIELQVAEPLIELRLFRNLHFTIGVGLMAMLSINLLFSAFYLPVFLQQGQGMQAFDAGLRVFPQAIAMCFASIIAGQYYDRIGPRVLCTFGCWSATVGNLLLAQLNPDTTDFQIVLWSSIRGFGMSLCAVSAITAAVNCVRPADTNQASAIENLLQQIFGAFGLAILGTLISSQQAQLTADRGAMIGPDSKLAQVAGPVIAQTTSMTVETFAMVYRTASQLMVSVLSTALANMFWLLAFTTVVGLAVSFLLPMRLLPVEEPEEVDEPEEPGELGELGEPGEHEPGSTPEREAGAAHDRPEPARAGRTPQPDQRSEAGQRPEPDQHPEPALRF
jgi:EmrB/QacA subfamily drug resistance transporter